MYSSVFEKFFENDLLIVLICAKYSSDIPERCRVLRWNKTVFLYPLNPYIEKIYGAS
jgi:hypothetical protein